MLLAGMKLENCGTQGPLCQAALQHVNPWWAALPGVILPQMQGIALPLLEHEVAIGPLIQPAVVPLVGNTTNGHIIVLPDASPHIENL